MQLVPWYWQLLQMVVLDAVKMHLTFRRLHSQQLWVPLRVFLRFGPAVGPSVCAFSSAMSGSTYGYMSFEKGV